MADGTDKLTPKLLAQLTKMRLPLGGSMPFRPVLDTNRRGEPVLVRRSVSNGPRADATGLLDQQGRIWVRDVAHAGVPAHWDVQLDGGADYIRVGYDGEAIP